MPPTPSTQARTRTLARTRLHTRPWAWPVSSRLFILEAGSCDSGFCELRFRTFPDCDLQAGKNLGTRERPRSTDARSAASPLSLPGGVGQGSLTAQPLARAPPPWATVGHRGPGPRSGRPPAGGTQAAHGPRAGVPAHAALSSPVGVAGSRGRLLPASGSEPALRSVPESADPTAVGAPRPASGSSACAEGQLQALAQTCLVRGGRTGTCSP